MQNETITSNIQEFVKGDENLKLLTVDKGTKKLSFHVKNYISAKEFITLYEKIRSVCYDENTNEFDWCLYNIVKEVFIYNAFTDVELPESIEEAYDLLAKADLLYKLGYGFGNGDMGRNQVVELDLAFDSFSKYANGKNKVETFFEEASGFINEVKSRMTDISTDDIKSLIDISKVSDVKSDAVDTAEK